MNQPLTEKLPASYYISSQCHCLASDTKQDSKT